MNQETDQDRDRVPLPIAAVAEEDADTSAGEYLANDDRTKAHGYNHLPHRPGRPDTRRQVTEARRGERRREEDPSA